MPIQDYLNPRDYDQYDDDKEYEEALGMLSGKLYVGCGFDMYEELGYFIETDGEIKRIQLEIAPETKGHADYGDLEVYEWLEKVFSTLNRPEVKFKARVAECVHEFRIKGGYKTVDEGVSLICEIFDHLIKNAPFPVVFEEYVEGEYGFNPAKFPCIQRGSKPKDVADAPKSDTLQKKEEEREAYDALSPEEKEDRFNKNISTLQGYGGFTMIGGPPNFSKKKDKIIHNGDNTIGIQKADGTVEVIGSVESLGRGQYFGTFGDLDDFPFESLDSAIYWIEECYRSKNGDGQFYKFQQAIKRRRDKGIEF